MIFQEDISIQDPWWKRYDFVFFHIAFLFVAYFTFRSFGMLDLVPLNEKLLQWDTGWYDDIRRNGYSYSDVRQSNSGFFPLFPYLWKWSGLTVFGISVLNGIITIIAIALLKRHFSFKKSHLLLAISLPSMFFLFIPYTESLFFLFSVVFLVGLKKQNMAWIAVGLFFASMTRSTGVFFLPALVYMVVISTPKEEVLTKHSIKRLLTFSLPIVAGTLAVVIWQWIETGIWFAYFKAQGAHWLRKIEWPVLPISTWNCADVLWLDAMAFLVGVFVLALAGYYAWKWLIGEGSTSTKHSFHFSIAYLAVVFLSLIFTSPKHPDTGITLISGANRYIFCSPFFFLLIQHYLDSEHLKKGIIVAVPLTWLLFNIYSVELLLPFVLLTVYCSGFLVLPMFKKLKPALSIILYLVGLVLQLYILDLYIRGEWVG